MDKRLGFTIWLAFSAICCVGVPLVLGTDRFGYVEIGQAGVGVNWFDGLSLLFFLAGGAYWIRSWRRRTVAAQPLDRAVAG